MKLEQLEKNNYYHIYNRGINGATIFKTSENKAYFLKLFKKYLSDKVTVLCFCLMDNRYHFAIKVITEEKKTTQAFSNLFNAYAKAYNKQEARTGSLFEKHFKRIKIHDESYLKRLIVYIHTNPQNHRVTEKFETYSFSSYQHFISPNGPKLIEIAKKEVLALFDDFDNMRYVHKLNAGNENRGSYTDTFEPLQVDLQGSKNLAGHMIKDKFYGYIQALQDTITKELEKVDGKAKFRQDVWKRPEGGGGKTRIIENGAVFEKGGVNISAVHGELPKSMQQYFGVNDADFFACGLSLVLHPKNPFVPTVHANWRYFEMYDKQGKIVDQWFGGGQDLTPYYLFEEDARHFHSVCKRACDKHDAAFYPQYKKRCDTYFWNSHRNEARGVGGLFFDYCKTNDAMDMQAWFAFVAEVGDSFVESYIPIVEKRKDSKYAQEQRDWQEIRRGRYVEFNLVHDKGTLFGLRTNGRIESILMSLPPHVQWRYDHIPEIGSREEELIQVLKKPREWV